MSMDPLASDVMEAAARLGLAPARVELLAPDTAAHRLVDEWLRTRFPIARWGRIDWAGVPGSTRATWDFPADAGEEITRIVASLPPAEGDVHFVWSNALRPIARLPRSVLASDVSPLLELDWDTWILALDEGWCIEVYHEGEVCFGFSPSLAAER